MQIIKIAFKNDQLQISQARPALIENNEGGYFWAFSHAQDGGKQGRIFLPIAGQAEPCPHRGQLMANDAGKRCDVCGTKHRRMDLGGGHESPLGHPDRGFVAPATNFVLRRTRSGSDELVPNDDHVGTLLLVRPNGAWVSQSRGLNVVAEGQDANGNLAPVLTARHPSALVFGRDDSPLAGAFCDEQGIWRACKPPQVSSADSSDDESAGTANAAAA